MKRTLRITLTFDDVDISGPGEAAEAVEAVEAAPDDWRLFPIPPQVTLDAEEAGVIVPLIRAILDARLLARPSTAP